MSIDIDVKYIIFLTDGAIDACNVEPCYSGMELDRDYREQLGGRIFFDKKNNRYGICDLVYPHAFFKRFETIVSPEGIHDYRASPVFLEVERRIEEYANSVKDA